MIKFLQSVCPPARVYLKGTPFFFYQKKQAHITYGAQDWIKRHRISGYLQKPLEYLKKVVQVSKISKIPLVQKLLFNTLYYSIVRYIAGTKSVRKALLSNLIHIQVRPL